jgi:segregation and condensation protein B
LEAVLFVSDKPLTLEKLKEVFSGATDEEIEATLTELKAELDSSGRAFQVEKVAGGYQLLTRPELDDTISAFKGIESKRRLSRAALETLAIIAYRQPIKRADIESVRGVSSMEILKGLLEMGLIKTAGRDNAPGAPLLYTTSDRFLSMFGLNSIEELPKPSEMK